MKTANKNNPVVVGALLGILAATLFFLMKQMGGGNAPVTLTPVADTRADDTPQATAAITAQSSRPDPFDHPALRRIAKDGVNGKDAIEGMGGMPMQSGMPEAQIVQGVGRVTPSGSKVPVYAANGPAVPAPRILPRQAQTSTVLPAAPVPGAGGPTGANPAGSGAEDFDPQTDDVLKGWRLTAIIAGQPPRAVIEGAGTKPYRVGVGERVRSLQVAAIHEREIVLCDAQHLYTLALLSAPSEPEDNKDNKDNKDASVEANSKVK